jgi:hypothetical protein
MAHRFSIGAVKTGNGLVLASQAEYRRAVSRFGDGTLLTVTIEETKETRPNWLNRFYWGWPIAITAEYCGYTKDEMHEAWKLKFLRLEDSDHPLPTVRSTSDLTEEEMKAYIQQIRIFAATEWNCSIPEINEHLEGEYAA